MYFNITKLGIDEAILGNLQLETVDLDIRFIRKKRIEWRKESPLKPIEGEFSISTINTILGEALYVEYVIKPYQEGGYQIYRVVTKLGWKELQEGKGIDPLEETNRLKDIPKEFRKYTKLFRMEDKVGLPLRFSQNYTIKLKLGI